MESQNLSKICDISLYYKTIDHNIFQDQNYLSLMNFIIQADNLYKYKYSFYTDAYMLRNNIFIPSFHTLYLSCGQKNVIIEDYQDLWLISTFKNNKYYIVKKNDDEFDYSDYDIKIIPNLQVLL